MAEVDLGFPKYDERGADINLIENIRKKLEDKCGLLDRALLQQFQTDYTQPLREDLATFEIWGRSLVDRLDINFIMAYLGEEDTMIVPERADGYGEYNICAHEMAHTFWDTSGERKGLLLLSDYDGPSITEIAAYAEKKVEGSEFDIVRNQQELIIINASINHFINTLPSILNKLLSERDSANSRLGNIKKELGGSGQIEITDNQQAQLDESLGNRRDLWEARKGKSSEFVSYWKDTLSPIIEELDEIVIRSRIDRSLLVSEEYSQTKQSFDEAMKRIKEIISELSEIHERYVEEANRGYEEVKRMKEDNHQAWLTKMQLILDDPDVEETEKQKVRERVKLEKDIFSLQETSGLLGLRLSSRQNMSLASKALIEELNQDSILEDATSSAKDIIGNPEEVFARMVDSLYSLYLGDIDQNNFSLTVEDLEFLSGMTYKGERIFGKGIEKYEVALQMREDGISIDDIRKQLFTAESFEYRGVTYNWTNEPFEIKGNIPYIGSIDDVINK